MDRPRRDARPRCAAPHENPPVNREPRQTDLPRISLVTPTLNQARFLEQAMRSVLDQGYPDLQYGVVDGGSTDGSLGILERYRDRLDYVISEPDVGQSDAINKGLARADGAIVGYLNSDDTLLPGSLARVGGHFARHATDDWLIGACRETDAAGRPRRLIRPCGAFTLAGALLRTIDIRVPQPATFWRRELSSALGGFDVALHHAMDFEMWCRFLAAGHRPVLLDAELATYRLHADSKTCAESSGFHRALIAIERRYLPRLPRRQRRALRRLIGYQTRALVLGACAGRPWRHVLRRPWWLGSQQVLRAMLLDARAERRADHCQA